MMHAMGHQHATPYGKVIGRIALCVVLNTVAQTQSVAFGGLFSLALVAIMGRYTPQLSLRGDSADGAGGTSNGAGFRPFQVAGFFRSGWRISP